MFFRFSINFPEFLLAILYVLRLLHRRIQKKEGESLFNITFAHQHNNYIDNTPKNICSKSQRASRNLLVIEWRSNRCDGVVVRASASQSVELGFNLLVESYQKILKHGIYFPTWRSVFRGCCGEQAGKSACCVLGQGTHQDAPVFMWKTGGPDTSEITTPKRVRTSRPKYSDTIRFLVNGE